MPFRSHCVRVAESERWIRGGIYGSGLRGVRLEQGFTDELMISVCAPKILDGGCGVGVEGLAKLMQRNTIERRSRLPQHRANLWITDKTLVMTFINRGYPDVRYVGSPTNPRVTDSGVATRPGEPTPIPSSSRATWTGRGTVSEYSFI